MLEYLKHFSCIIIKYPFISGGKLLKLSALTAVCFVWQVWTEAGVVGAAAVEVEEVTWVSLHMYSSYQQAHIRQLNESNLIDG